MQYSPNEAVAVAKAQGLSCGDLCALPSLPMASYDTSKQAMLNAIQETVQQGIQYLQDKNIHHTARFFYDSFEVVAQCELAATTDSSGGLTSLSKAKPCVTLTQCDVAAFIPRQEVYLVDIDVLGTIREVFDDEGKCDVEITAVGLDEFDRICPISEVLTWNSLQGITRQWEALPTPATTSMLTEWLGTATGVAIYKGTFSPHDYASDTNAIQNSDLVHLLYDTAAFFFRRYPRPRQSTCHAFSSSPVPRGVARQQTCWD